MEPEQINPFTVIAAIAGSISGLAFMPWEEMSWKKIALTIFVGFTCALFVAPYITHKIYGAKETAQQVAFVTYITGVGAHIILPKIIKLISRALGDKA